MASRGEFLWAGFAKNASLYRRMSTKYKSSKLFWRILEDNKQNKRENWGKETLRICACKSPIAELSATCSWNGDDSFPFRLRFAFRRQILAYSSFSLSRNKHGTKKYIWNRPVEEAKKMKCYKRVIYKQFVQILGICGPQFLS